MVEPALPESGHLTGPVDQRTQSAELRAVISLATFMAVPYQPGPFQSPEMLRHGRLGNSCPGGQCSDRAFSLPTKPLEDCAAGRIGQRMKKRIVGLWHFH